MSLAHLGSPPPARCPGLGVGRSVAAAEVHGLELLFRLVPGHIHTHTHTHTHTKKQSGYTH